MQGCLDNSYVPVEYISLFYRDSSILDNDTFILKSTHSPLPLRKPAPLSFVYNFKKIQNYFQTTERTISVK